MVIVKGFSVKNLRNLNTRFKYLSRVELTTRILDDFIAVVQHLAAANDTLLKLFVSKEINV